MINDIKKVHGKVEMILEKYPQTRDSDKLLWLGYLVLFHDLKTLLGDDSYAKFRDLLLSENTPSMESIRRTRQKIQEEGKYLGTERIKKLRDKENELVRDWSLGIT